MALHFGSTFKISVREINLAFETQDEHTQVLWGMSEPVDGHSREEV